MQAFDRISLNVLEVEAANFRRVFFLFSRVSFVRCEIFEEFTVGPRTPFFFSSSCSHTFVPFLLLLLRGFLSAVGGRFDLSFWHVSLGISWSFSNCASIRTRTESDEASEASNVALSSLSIRADSVELPSSKVSASNEAINKSTALTGLLHAFRSRRRVHPPVPVLFLPSPRVQPLLLSLLLLLLSTSRRSTDLLSSMSKRHRTEPIVFVIFGSFARLSLDSFFSQRVVFVSNLRVASRRFHRIGSRN